MVNDQLYRMKLVGHVRPNLFSGIIFFLVRITLMALIVSTWLAAEVVPPSPNNFIPIEPSLRELQTRCFLANNSYGAWPVRSDGQPTPAFPPNGWYNTTADAATAANAGHSLAISVMSTPGLWLNKDQIHNGMAGTIFLNPNDYALPTNGPITYADCVARIQMMVGVMKCVYVNRQGWDSTTAQSSVDIYDSPPYHADSLTLAIDQMTAYWGSDYYVDNQPIDLGRRESVHSYAWSAIAPMPTSSFGGLLQSYCGAGLQTDYNGIHDFQVWCKTVRSKFHFDFSHFPGHAQIFISLRDYYNGNQTPPLKTFSNSPVPVDSNFYTVDETQSDGLYTSPLIGPEYPSNSDLFDSYQSNKPSWWYLYGVFAAVDMDFSVPHPPCNPCLCQVPTAAPKNGGAGGPIPSTTTKGLSSARNDNLAFLHTATDYKLTTSRSGCVPCGGGGIAGQSGLPPLIIERIFAPLTNASGSFGWNTYLGTDLRLTVTVNSVTMTDPRSSGYNVVFPRDGGGQPTISMAHLAKSVRAIDTMGAPVSVDTAAIVEVAGWNDQSLRFELSPAINGQRYGRLLRTIDGSGNATSLAYRYVATDLVGDPTITGKWWALSTITGPVGDVATVTTSITPVSGGYPITGIALPDGKSLTYTYGSLATIGGVAITGLKDVAHPDGTHTTFSGAVNATGDLDFAINDPAETDSAHQQKTVTLSKPTWVDPLTGVPAPWAVRAVRNPAGELVYANQRIITVTEQWTVIWDHGAISRLVTDRDGSLLRTDQTTGPVTWTTEPATWPWQALASYNISLYSRLDQSTDVLGRTSQWANAIDTGLTNGTTDAAGQASSVTRDAAGHTLSETDRLGRVTTYTRDAAGNALTTTRAFGTADQSTESAIYDVRGLLLSRTDALGHTTNYTYNAAGQLLTETQPPDVPNGPRGVTTRAYDAVGRLTSITDPQGRVTSFAYDPSNRLERTTYADATFELLVYGTSTNAGRLITRTDRNGTVTTFGYDAAGRKNLTSRIVTSATGTTETHTEACTFVPGTELESSCTRNGETTAYVYDFRNRRIAQVVYVGLNKTRTTQWTYDVADRRITETDPDGRITYFVYDVLDRVVRTVREAVPGAILDPANVATLVRDLSDNAGFVIDETEYDAEGQVLARVDGRGNRTSFGYDALGRMTSRTEGANSAIAAKTTYVYDAAGNQTEVRPPVTGSTGAPMVTLTTYTQRNLPATRTEAVGLPEQGITSFTYFADGKVATTTDANLKTTANSYSPCCGRLLQTQDPLGFLTKYMYDGVGNVLTVTDANNNVTSTTYDAANRPLKRTDALGKIWTYTYDENLTDGVGIDAAATYGPLLTGLGFGRDVATGYGADGSAVAVKDPNGNETVTIYDGARRVVRTIDGTRQKSSVAYDIPVTDTVTLPGGGTASIALMATRATDPAGAITEQWSDGLGRVRVSVDALGKRLRASFDASGNRVAFVDADGVGHTCTFDARNRQSTCSNAGSGAVSMAYDGEGRVTSRTDARGIPETSFYDGRGRRLSTTDRINGTTLFTYDPVGNLKTITDAQGGVTTYLYDARNLLISETFPGTTGGTRVYTYDPGRRLSTRKDQTLAITTYLYDKANHLTTRKYPDAKNDTFTYDAAGRLTKAVSARYGSTVDRTYDKANRVLTEKLTLGTDTWTVTGAYDTVGRLTKLTLPDATVQDRAYSLRGELTSAKLASASIATRTYTDGGRLSETTQGNTRKETRTYRPADGLVDSIATPGVSSFSYTYDTLLRKTAEIDLITPSNTQRFTYDDASRLTAWDRITGTAGAVETAQSWNLSLVGDWQNTVRDGVTETRTHTPVHEISTINGVTLTNDVKGNLTRDAQGQTFAWDVENRLASAAALVQQAGDTSASYVYDALGRRVRKLVGQIETTFVSWGAQEVYQLQRNPTAIAADQPPTTATNGGAVPVTSGTTYPAGALLADASAVRVSFRPSSVPAPTGWLADTGLIYGVRTGGQSYGWVGAALNQTINRDWLGWTLYDTYNQLWTTWKTVGSTPAKWELAVANGTYPVSIVCGDARAIQQRNDLLLEGVTLLDPNPWNGVAANPTTGELGNFVTLSGMATVTDGKLTLTAASTAKAPKICFIEVGAVGTTFDANYAARASAAIAQVKARTATGRPDAVKPVITANVYGSYVDELLGYRVQKSVGTYATKTSYWVNSNHLYSVAATTDATGSVVERYSYNAYGARTVKDAANVVLMKSAVGQDRGFTGYRFDGETGLYFARARWYSPKLGRFVSRDPSEYIDGFSLYPAYFAPNKLDSTGLATTTPISKPEGDWAITITPSDEVGVTATNNSNGVINWGFKPKGSCCVDGYFTQKLKYVIWKKGKYVSLPLAPSRPGDPTPGGIHDGIWDHEENSHPTNPDGYMNGAGGDNSDQPNGLPDKNTLQIPWPVTTGGTPVQGYKVFEVCYNCGSGETKAVKSCFTWHVEITFHGLVTPILGEP